MPKMQVENKDRLLRMSQVQDYIPFSRAKIYQMLKEKTFPQPIKIGRSNVWRESEILKYVKKIK